MAQRYSTTPAQLLGIDDPVAAWCVNEAALYAGAYRERELAEADKTKQGDLRMVGQNGKLEGKMKVLKGAEREKHIQILKERYGISS